MAISSSNCDAEVREGVRSVAATYSSPNEIQAVVTTIEQNMKSLTETTSLQSPSLAEIMGAVRILDRITRENAQLATRTTELSRCVAQGALHVGEVVSTFKLNRRGAIREPGPPEGGAKLQNHAIR